MNQAPKSRIPVWIALSEIYLDTVLSSSDFDKITETLSISGYSIEELKLIDLFEVFPSVGANLMGVAGTWSGFDEEWLIEECSKNYLRRNNSLFKLKIKISNWLFGMTRINAWKELDKRLNE